MQLTERRPLGVTAVTRLVRGLIESDDRLQDIWVEGEVSNFRLHSSGHMYFTLKDAGATLRCVMFRSRASTLAFRPEGGMQVLVRGSLGVFERDGQYQMYAEAMEPAGQGGLHAAFEQLRRRLEAEGLFAAAGKRPLPALPRRVALVTSPTGAAVRDMIRIAQRRFPNVHLVVVPVRVQGPEAPADLVRGLALAGGIGADVVVVGRGGGSLEELWAFNNEAVARAIRACPLPVVSAVGHETDFTIADFAADVRAPTPSAAAELAVPERATLERQLDGLSRRVVLTLRRRLGEHRRRLDLLRARRSLRDPAALLAGPRQRLDGQVGRLEAAWRLRSAERAASLRTAAGRLQALSPLACLSRGYSVCRTPAGAVVRRAEQVPIGGLVEVLLAEGSLDCRVVGRGPGIEGVRA
jgi:exodeoxyribonuclease VII large subunit